MPIKRAKRVGNIKSFNCCIAMYANNSCVEKLSALIRHFLDRTASTLYRNRFIGEVDAINQQPFTSGRNI